MLDVQHNAEAKRPHSHLLEVGFFLFWVACKCLTMACMNGGAAVSWRLRNNAAAANMAMVRQPARPALQLACQSRAEQEPRLPQRLLCG